MSVVSEQALIKEGDSFLVTLQQTFLIPPAIPAGPLSLTFDLVSTGFDNTNNFIPDAFEVALLDANNLPLAEPWDSLATSYFNIQQDGTMHLGSTTTWDPGAGSITLVLNGIDPGTVATLFFDFIGADPDTGGSVTIDNVRLGCPNNAGGLCERMGVLVVQSTVDTGTVPPESLLVCKVYAQLFDSHDKLLSVLQANIIETDPSGFWHHDNGRDTAPDESACNADPDVCLDSFVTIGLDIVGQGQMDDTTLDESFDSPSFNTSGDGRLLGSWYDGDFSGTSTQGVPDEQFRVLVAQLTVQASYALQGGLKLKLGDGTVSMDPLAVRCSCPTNCEADLNCDGEVRVPDLIILLGKWGPCPEPCDPGKPGSTCLGDFDGNCEVRVPDLIVLLGAWGDCP